MSVLLMVVMLTTSCASLGTNQSLGCLGVGALAGAAVGAGVGAASSRKDRATGALIGAAIGAGVGALAGLATCVVLAEHKSQQVRDYGQTREALRYEPAQGDTVQITNYTLTPGAAAPGSEVAFSATYLVMTPNADQDISVTETRILRVRSPDGSFQELGRAPSLVTVKPGTRQADGKFEVRSRVAEGEYQLIFQVAKNGTNDSKELPLIVTKDQAVLGDSSKRVVQVVSPEGSKAPVQAIVGPAHPAAPPQPTPPAASQQASGDSSLAALGERDPKAPPVPASAPAPTPVAKAPPEQIAYFQAARVGTLRKGPGTQHPPVGSVKTGERYPIVERSSTQGTWYKIRLDSGLEAWIAASAGADVKE